MKKIILLIVAVLFATSLFAENVNQNKAKQVAKAFASQHDRNAAQLKTDIVYSHPMPNKRDAAFYVVNLGETGFVIVAANDVAHPVIGYSFDRPWPTEGNIPPQITDYLDDLAGQIEAASQNQPDQATKTEWQELLAINLNNPPQPKGNRIEVGPLLTTTWDQGQYYNAMCPEDENGPDGHVVTGCVATAMAQIINYHQYPASGRGVHNYECNYGVLAVNFEEYTYQYNNMANELNYGSTDSQISAVAKLISDCGVAVNMTYSASESGAYVPDARAALINFFRYSPDLSFAEKSLFSDDEWNTMLRDDLNAGRPIIYSGYGAFAGHTFICDGFNTEGYYHFNFGWSGEGDAWYLIDAVNPLYMDFNSNQNGLLGITPDANGNIFLAQTGGNSTFTVDEPIEFYHLLGHNAYQGVDYTNSFSSYTTFVASDLSTPIVTNLLHYGGDQSVSVYYGNGNDYHMVYPEMTWFPNLESFDGTFTMYYGGYWHYAGFCLNISQQSPCGIIPFFNISPKVDVDRVNLSWTDDENSEWNIEYGFEGFSHGNGETLTIQSPNATIDNLSYDAYYDVYIKPSCSNIWTGPIRFRTDLSYWQDYVNEEPEGIVYNDDGYALVSTPEQLAWLIRRNSTCEKLLITDNLDMSGHRWKPESLYPYYGKEINGGGHVISNLLIRESKASLANYIGFLGNYSPSWPLIVCDLTFVNPSVSVERSIYRCGVLAGEIRKGNFTPTIFNCGVESGVINCSAYTTGGLVGSFEGDMLNCFSNVSVNNQHVNPHTGGLVGDIYDGRVINCYSNCEIVYSPYTCSKAQIAASVERGVLRNVYGIDNGYDLISQVQFGEVYDVVSFGADQILNSGVVFDDNTYYDLCEALNSCVQDNNDNSWRCWSRNSVGDYPVLGELYQVTCSNAANIMAFNVVHEEQYTVKLTWVSDSSDSYIIKCINVSDTTENVKYYNANSSPYYIEGLHRGDKYEIYVRCNCEESQSGWGQPITHIFDIPYWTDVVTSRPAGYEEDASGNIIISSSEGLSWFASCVNGFNGNDAQNFRNKTITLVSDVDLAQYRWIPIGNTWANDFQGVFNGNGHIISDLYVNEDSDYVGVFGKLWQAKVMNLTIKNSYAKGNRCVGGICGVYMNNEDWWAVFNYGYNILENCHVVESVVYGKDAVGGLCGATWPCVDGTTILNCSSSGEVRGGSNFGGLIGDLTQYGNKIVQNCYSVTNVYCNNENGHGSDFFGGLIGYLFNAEINNCYTAGLVDPTINGGWGGSMIGVVDNSHVNYLYGILDTIHIPFDTYNIHTLDNVSEFLQDGQQTVLQNPVTIGETSYTNLLSALNAWVDANSTNGEYLHWVADTENQNGGFPMLERLPAQEYQIQQLASGWNWYSTYIEQNDADGLSMLESGLGSHGELIMSRTGAMVENFDGSFWWGDLNAVTNEEMYEIKTNAQTNVVMTGGKANPSSHPITVAPGWNWIGYVSDTSNSIDNALSSLTSNEDDIIQSRNAFSSYFPGYGWYGDLENMTPGQGYMYKSNGTVSQTLVYPTASRSNESEAVAYHNQADYNRYRNVMDVMAKVIINGEPANSNRYELAAFVDGECRGRTKLQYVEPIETYLAFITINGNEGEEIEFRLYDEDRTETYEADDSNIVLFKPNEVIGKFRAPYIIRFSNDETEGTTLFTIYPNPVDKDAEFTIDIPTNEKIVEVIITNSVGSIIRDERALKGNILKGLPQSGIYAIQIITEKGNNYRGRVIVK